MSAAKEGSAATSIKERKKQLQADRMRCQQRFSLQPAESASNDNESPANLTSAMLLAADSRDGAAPFSPAQSSALIRYASAPSPVRIPLNSIGLTYLHSLLSADECHQLLAAAEAAGYRRSWTSHGISRHRTSFTAQLSSNSSVVCAVRRRVAQLVGVSVNQLEELAVVRYEPGQQYLPHHDSGGHRSSFRQFTLFVYLNSLEPEAGGETEFPRIGIKFAPRAGDAIWWRNHTDRYSESLEDSKHAGRPPLRGVKYGLNCWIGFAAQKPRAALVSIRRVVPARTSTPAAEANKIIIPTASLPQVQSAYGAHTWRIPLAQWRAVGCERVYSPEFVMDGERWRLLVKPNQLPTHPTPGCVGLYLELRRDPPYAAPCFFKMAAIHPSNGGKTKWSEGKHAFSERLADVGFHNLLMPSSVAEYTHANGCVIISVIACKLTPPPAHSLPQSAVLTRCTQLPSPVRIPANSIGLTYLHSFLSPQECDEFIRLGRDYSQTTFVGRVSSDATSSTSFLHSLSSASPSPLPPSVAAVRARVAELTGQPLDCVQGPNIVRYMPGQLIRPHWNSSAEAQRTYSMIVYLNSTLPGEGGETEFVKLRGVRIKPKQGDALIWRNHADESKELLPEAEHQGLPLRSGIKYGQWRERWSAAWRRKNRDVQ